MGDNGRNLNRRGARPKKQHTQRKREKLNLEGESKKSHWKKIIKKCYYVVLCEQ
jgi:hypothetical protein